MNPTRIFKHWRRYIFDKSQLWVLAKISWIFKAVAPFSVLHPNRTRPSYAGVLSYWFVGAGFFRFAFAAQSQYFRELWLCEPAAPVSGHVSLRPWIDGRTFELRHGWAGETHSGLGRAHQICGLAYRIDGARVFRDFGSKCASSFFSQETVSLFTSSSAW